MDRGVILVAHNNGKEDYLKMAKYTASRVNKFLDLPVTLVTDRDTYTGGGDFEYVRYVEPDTSNTRKNSVWINKGRYKLYDLSPYDDTLVLDTDYLINSRQLLAAFTYNTDFMCHKNVRWLMEDTGNEWILKDHILTNWATVLRFKKTSKTKQIFDLIKEIQENYKHYSNIYNFSEGPFRNDYALTIALKIVNGHHVGNDTFFWWRLLHVGLRIKVHRDSDTSYTLVTTDKRTGKEIYIKVKDIDFHMLNKANFCELL